MLAKPIASDPADIQQKGGLDVPLLQMLSMQIYIFIGEIQTFARYFFIRPFGSRPDYSTSSFLFFGLYGLRIPRFEERMNASTSSRSGDCTISASTISQALE